MGAGMVRVLEMSGIDPIVYSGFAFGLNPERYWRMLRYQNPMTSVASIKDVRFSEQFK